MDIKLFTDLYNALRNVVTDLMTIVNLPKVQRDQYRRVIDETFRFIDTTLNIVIYQLGNIMQMEDDQDFLREVSKLDNNQEWAQRERIFGLCNNLHVTFREADTLSGRLGGHSLRDWDTLLREMSYFFQAEEYTGHHISQQLRVLASQAWDARNAPLNAETIRTIRERVAAARETLIQQREDLIRQEHAFYDAL